MNGWGQRRNELVLGAAAAFLALAGWHAYLAPDNVFAVLAVSLLCGY